MNKHPIVERISAAMEREGITKAELSRLAGIPYHRLNPWFIRPNAKPNGEDIELVAKALKVTVEHLASGAPMPNRRDWIMNVYDQMPPDLQREVERYARYLVERDTPKDQPDE